MSGYYGWRIVAMSVVVLMLTIGTTINAFGMFVLPVSEDFGLSRANVNTGMILINVGMAFVSPVLGRMLDVYPIKRIMAVCSVLFGGSLVVLGLSHSIWLSALVLAVPLSMGIAGAGNLTCTTLVARWFEAQRGRAMAIAVMGMSLGTVVMPQLVAMLLETVGWRQCLVILGIATTVIFLLMVPFVRVRPGPDDIEPRPRGVAMQPQPAALQSPGVPLPVARILRMPVFWMTSLSVGLSLAAMQTTAISLVPIAQEGGLSVGQSASLLSVMGAASILSKFILAWVGDRFDRVSVLTVLFCLIALTSALLMVGSGYAALMAVSALLGLAVGAVTPMFYALLADRIGVASFGSATGIAAFIMSVMGAVAIRFGGEVYDRTGTYDLMFVTFIGIGVISAIMMLASRRLGRAPVAALAVSPPV